MNFIGHHEVAIRKYPKSSLEFRFGSILGDLARMSGSRRILSNLPKGELADGNSFHAHTNIAFDRQPYVISLEKYMKQSFEDFLSWRTAIQASRAGKDLLFDGTLICLPSTLDELDKTLNFAHEAASTLIETEDNTRLISVIGKLASSGPPNYDQPEVTSKALINTLSKTRTPIGWGHLNSVTKVVGTYLSPTLMVRDEVIEGTLTAL